MILNFTIPKELYSQIDDYDVKKPKIVAPQAPARPRRVNNFPKAGIPEQLVPTSVIPKEQLIQIIQQLNTAQTDSYYYDSRTVVHENGENKIMVTKVANKYWFALWFNPNDEKTLFGHSVCLRNLKSYKSSAHGRFWGDNGVTEDDFAVVRHNKKDYLYYQKIVKKEDLVNRTFKCKSIRIDTRNEQFYLLFQNKLKKHILVWDKYSVFEAYTTSIADLVGNYQSKDDFSWTPDYKFLIKKLGNILGTKFIDKLETPFFRKKLTSICENFIKKYNSSDFDRWDNKLETPNFNMLEFVDKIYDYEVSVDYLQQLWNEFDFDSDMNKYKYFSYRIISEETKNWFRENVPVKSFINMFTKDYRNVVDSVSMITDVLRRNPDVKYNGRWRAQEFHDWAMGEQWKICNKNEKLPQDLFPNPIKVDKMTFIQPISTHQLSNYGRAARNCVGSSTYSNGILKKNHFIILALKDNEPYLTIQARLENEQLNVIQIKKNCNAGLLPHEEKEYHDAFKKALMIRSQELVDAVQ